MATENPMRIVDSPGTASFTSSSANSVVSDELGLLLRGHDIHSGHTKIAPNRSGSAPPSMEGSFAAFGNLVNQQTSQDLLRYDSTYHHLPNTNLNPRLLSRHAGVSGNNSRLLSVDSRLSGSMYMSRSSLSIHEEEPEDVSSPTSALGNRGKRNSIKLGQNKFSITGRHKSLVDLIQEDFPRTPSPVFSQTHSSSHVEEPSDHDIQSLSLDSLSLKPKPSERKSGVGTGVKTDMSSGSTAIKDHSEASLLKSSSLDIPGRSLSSLKDELTSKDVCFTSDLVSGGTTVSDSSKCLHEVEDDQDKQEPGFDEHIAQNELSVQNTYSEYIAGYHIPESQVQGTDLGANKDGMEKVSYGHVKLTSVEMQPLVHSPGVTHPLYATTAAYMAPGSSIYPNLGASGLYTPQYSGYALSSSFLPPYLAGYSPNTGYPLQFNANSGQSFSGQSAGILTGESISKGSNMPNSNRFYGHPGLTMHPNFPDPVPLQYFPQSVQDPYGIPLQYSQLPSPSMVSRQVDSFALPSDPTVAAYTGDKKFQLPPNMSVSIPSPRKIGLPSSSYLSSPTGLGFVTQFPGSPLSSPVLPESPVGSATSLGRPYDFGFSQSSPRNVCGWARWQGQRASDSINDHRKHSFLEELKASSGRRIDLSDIVGRIVEFSVDQHGSRFVQQKLENCSLEEKELVFKEVFPHASKLITDVFGNYVIQKFFEHGTSEQRKELANQLSGQMLPLSLQMYGCRVIQKALEVIELDQKTELVLELDGHVIRCVRDQNGNHVIQKCIECVPPEKINFIISAFKGQVAILSTHPYGCRVIQRVLEHCADDLLCRSIVDEILESAYDLAQDQYGNYVTQHVLERGQPFERSHIISKLSGKIVQMSQHKYASNVVEKCLEYGDATERELLIDEILLQSEDNDNLLPMMKDQFANYVVQKILEISNDKQRGKLLDRIRLHLIALKKYTYGKHIVARFEQLCGEDDISSCDEG